jgi:transcription initiation factor TFIIIB Brf1 subunit/transcription initiation factor TFIIB
MDRIKEIEEEIKEMAKEVNIPESIQKTAIEFYKKGYERAIEDFMIYLSIKKKIENE